MKVRLGPHPKRGERRISVEIEDFDTWGLDHSLALIVLPALIQLRDTMHGVPSEFGDVPGASYDEQLSFDFYLESHNAAFDVGCKNWQTVLEKMIWSFQQIALDEDYESQYFHGEAKFRWDPVEGETGVTQLVDENPDEHWIDHEGIKEHNARIQEGLELFGKYFRNLWD